MRVIILVRQNLNKTFYKNWELEYKKKKIDFQFWSLLPLANKKLFKIYSNKNYRTISHSKFIFIKSYKHLFKKISGIKGKTYVLNEVGGFFHNLIEFFLIKKGCLKIKKFDSAFANYNNTNIYEDFKRILNYGYLFLIKKIITRLIIYFKNFLLKIISIDPSYYITPNEISYDELKEKKLNSKIFKYNSSLFNQFKKIAHQKSKKNNIVFIDQELEKSWEQKVGNYTNLVDKQKYWNCLNEIFNYFEKKLKIKVIIAAHFRRSKDKKNLPNIGRKFIFDKTPELIKNSKLVIGHHSIALNYAILMQKPIVLLDFRLFDSSNLQNNKHLYFLGKKISAIIIHIDTKYKFNLNKKIFKNLFKINKKKYNNFGNYYLGFRKYKNVHQNIWSAISRIS
jgi:hypothetical protein